jgi:hypothetical protein
MDRLAEAAVNTTRNARPSMPHGPDRVCSLPDELVIAGARRGR